MAAATVLVLSTTWKGDAMARVMAIGDDGRTVSLSRLPDDNANAANRNGRLK
jgi:hypothetical protein